MKELEQLLGSFVAACPMQAARAAVGAPYPFSGARWRVALRVSSSCTVLRVTPGLVLALFVAPALLDAAFDASLRDLRDNWAPVTGLVIVAVGLTTAAVAVVVHVLVPAMPWAAAVALGAIVAPPDAVAARPCFGRCSRRIAS